MPLTFMGEHVMYNEDSFFFRQFLNSYVMVIGFVSYVML